MICAEKSNWFRKLFYFYQHHYLFPRHFHSICVKGPIDDVLNRPTLYIANHSSWWDGLLSFQITEKFSGGDHYIMMDDRQLAHYKFFRKLGAFSVNKKRPHAVMESLCYAVNLLKNKRSVWMFPQGDIYPLEKRPLSFQSGLGYLLQRVPETILKPVSFYYAFDNQQKPTASVWFGEGIHKDWSTLKRGDALSDLECILMKQLNAHKEVVLEDSNYKETQFKSIIKIGKSTSDRFDGLKRGFKG